MTLCWLKTSSQVHVGEDLQTQQKNWKLIHSIGRSKGSWIESSLKCVLVEILWPPLQSYTGFPQGHCKADPASSFQRFIDYKRNSCLISRCWRLNPGTNGFFSKIGFQHKSVNARNGDIWATKWIRRPQIWDTVESLEVESMKLSRRLDKPFMVQGHQHEERGMYIKNTWFERKRACAHEYEIHHLGWLISLEIHLKPFAYTIARCFPHGFLKPNSPPLEALPSGIEVSDTWPFHHVSPCPKAPNSSKSLVPSKKSAKRPTATSCRPMSRLKTLRKVKLLTLLRNPPVEYTVMTVLQVFGVSTKVWLDPRNVLFDGECIRQMVW